MHRPIKTRRLKKADREADFFFMNGYDVDGIETRISPMFTNADRVESFVAIRVSFSRVVSDYDVDGL